MEFSGVSTVHLGLVDSEMERHIELDCCQLLTHVGIFFFQHEFFFEFLGKILGFLGAMLQDAVHLLNSVELFDEICGRLLPHPFHAWNVVRGITTQGFVINDVFGTEAVAYDNVFRRVQHGIIEAFP